MGRFARLRGLELYSAYNEGMTGKEAEARFWDHALRVYGDAEVRAALLRLQDEQGADIPMILWCLWRGAEGVAIPGAIIEAGNRFSSEWRAGAVAPLRNLRRALKRGVDGAPAVLTEAARAKVAQTEQDCEQLQMAHLAVLSPEPGAGDPRQAAAANLDAYAARAGLSLGIADRNRMIMFALAARNNPPLEDA